MVYWQLKVCFVLLFYSFVLLLQVVHEVLDQGDGIMQPPTNMLFHL